MGKSADPINLIEGVTDLTRENYCEKIFGRTNPTDICTVGTGIMDIPEIVKTVTELDYAPYIIVELDCCAVRPKKSTTLLFRLSQASKQAASISKALSADLNLIKRASFSGK